VILTSVLKVNSQSQHIRYEIPAEIVFIKVDEFSQFGIRDRKGI